MVNFLDTTWLLLNQLWMLLLLVVAEAVHYSRPQKSVAA
jgi:hypothetical protein